MEEPNVGSAHFRQLTTAQTTASPKLLKMKNWGPEGFTDLIHTAALWQACAGKPDMLTFPPNLYEFSKANAHTFYR